MFVLPKRRVVDVRLVWRLVQLMRRERIGLLQTYLFTANTWARLAAIIARDPVIVTSARNVDIWEQDAKRIIGRWLDHWTHRTSGNSEAVVAYLAGKGVPRDKLRVIYNGVDTTRFEEPVAVAETKAELGIPPHHSVVCLLARLEPQKDPRVFLQAAAMLAGRMPAVSFLVVGGGTLRPDLEREAEKLGIRDHVIFTGPRRDVHRLLAACDVSVNSSLKEGMSNTIMRNRWPRQARRRDDGGRESRAGPGGRDRISRAAPGRWAPSPSPSSGCWPIPSGRRPWASRAARASRNASPWMPWSMRRSGSTTRYRVGKHRLAARCRAWMTRRTVGLVASQFPRHVDAYFLREISALAARVRFRIFSLRTFQSDIVHAAARPSCGYRLCPLRVVLALLRANGRFLRRNPGRYLELAR